MLIPVTLEKKDHKKSKLEICCKVKQSKRENLYIYVHCLCNICCARLGVVHYVSIIMMIDTV